jgi:hypothetical protein
VPVLAGLVRPYGRARVLPRFEPPAGSVPPADTALGGPCTFAAWPVIGVDGTITACCNQAVVDGVALPGGGRPAHLELGHAARDGWPEVRERCLTTPLLKAIRALGPHAPARLAGEGHCDDGYCQACWQLPGSQAAARWAASPAARPVIGLAERQVVAAAQRQGPAGFVRRQGSSRFADLVVLGREDG